MQSFNNQNEESRFLDDLGNQLTNGRYSIIQRVTLLLISANSMLLMVVLNKNMGREIARNGASLFALIWLFFLYFCALETAAVDPVTGMVTDLTFSGPLLYIHGVVFLLFSMWRRFGAWWNMRNSGRNSIDKRFEYSIGGSVVYPLIRWIMRPFKLIDNEEHPKTFWKMNEDRWMQFWQPLLLLLLGLWVLNIGYVVYGRFLIIATLCFFGLTFKAFDNTARIRQTQEGAQEMGRIIRPGHEEDKVYIVDGE
jgi:hypothetical protein